MATTHDIPVNTDQAAIEEILTRGVSEVIVLDDLRKKLLSGKRLRIKLGIDPTSPDLHIGRAVPLLKLRDFQKLGHQIVLIVGDFTAIIGDTSDKDAERPMLSKEVIEKNKQTYFAQAGKILDLAVTELCYNSAWLEPLGYREIGEHADAFSVADFIARDVIKRRLDAGKRVSLREMIYPLMQGYDSVAVRADVELGSMDQKFNLLAGRTLQEKMGQEAQNIVMSPLINGLDGTKMSSSRGNYISLTAEPGDMYGKVMSVIDAEVPTYFEVCTRVPMAEVAEIVQKLSTGELHPKEVKMRLAREIVTLYHNKEAAEAAEKAWEHTFSQGGVPEEVPETTIASGVSYLEALEVLGESRSELRRLAEAGAISVVGGETITNLSDVPQKEVVLRIGKHRFLKIRVA